MKKKVLLECLFFSFLSLGLVAIANAQNDDTERNDKPARVKVEVEVTEDGETTTSVQEIELDVDHWNKELASMLEEMELSIQKAMKDIDDADIEIIIQKELNDLDLPDFQSTIRAIPRFHYQQGSGEARAFLGVEGTALNEIEKANTKLEKGVRIRRVVPGSAAEAIGLQRGMIITSIDGQEVGNFDELANAIRSHAPKDKLKLEVYRDGKLQKQEVILGSTTDRRRQIHMEWQGEDGDHSYVFPPHAPQGQRPFMYHSTKHPKGLRAECSGGFLGIEGETVDQGVKIIKVIDATPAAEAGLQEGDIITELDEDAIEDIQALIASLSKRKAGEEITVRYLRGEQVEQVSTTLAAFPKEIPFEEEKSFRYEVRIGAVNEEEIDRISQQSEEELDRTNALEPIDLTIGPNPSSGVFMMNLELESNDPVKLQVFDAQGGKVMEKEVQANTDGYILTKIDLSEQAEGMYFVSLLQSGKGIMKRLIKQ